MVGGVHASFLFDSGDCDGEMRGFKPALAVLHVVNGDDGRRVAIVLLKFYERYAYT